MKSRPWRFSRSYNSTCQIIEEQELWGQRVCRVWLPTQNAVVRVPFTDLRPLDDLNQPSVSSDFIAYVAAAAKVAEVLELNSTDVGGPVLLAPMESNVIPLPHQIRALSRAISGDRVRYLLADEVGLGKTIEAGLIIRELKLRGLVKRTLVVAPKGLATQWVAEMRNHFNEDFQLVLGEDLTILQRMQQGSHAKYWARPSGLKPLDASNANNPWHVFDQVIVSLDSVKPMDRRRGWSQEKLDAYNRARYEDLITAGWDLVIVDEAHRLGGSTEQVARYKLGKGLSEAAPYVLLVSATPHQGKTDAFHRLMNLLDEKAFPDLDSVTRDRVAPFVIRTEKRRAINADGDPLFKPRRTKLATVAWEDKHHRQKLLYEAVTEYAREGYNQAILEQKRHIGFLMILMQRLVVSSTRAIRTTLERRLAALQQTETQASKKLDDLSILDDSEEGYEDVYDMDGQALLDELLSSRVAALRNELLEVETLHRAAVACEQAGPDAKAEALIDWIYQLQSEENEPDLKLLIFTEFVPTQQMLKEFLETRGISVVTLNGSMDMNERRIAQESFRNTHRVLISTDAGGEGLNLQFAHVVINYDIPWNPMRLEQRIGRVDRIGQPKTVRAINFVFQDSVEYRVREVLEQKLAIIFEEFGIDKTGDVLDSARSGEIFEEVFTTALTNPEAIEKSADRAATRIREEIQSVRENSAIYGISDEPDRQAAEQLRSHPLPHWVERMTVSFINSQGGIATKRRKSWDLKWPHGEVMNHCVFSSAEAETVRDSVFVNLENPRIRGLALNLPQFSEGQPIPQVATDQLPLGMTGFWGLFEIRLNSRAIQAELVRVPTSKRGFIAVFLSDDNKLFLPTARHVWETLLTASFRVVGSANQADSIAAFQKLLEAVEAAGKDVHESLKNTLQSAVKREEERGTISFESRRKSIERVGLPEVRQYRLDRCNAEEQQWRMELSLVRETVPEIRPLMVLRLTQDEVPE
ncbi:MAG TPA: helicase-related protein [Pirellulaceae bacterium]|nr:helicase-related protein [Pirellulaceae bacterium]